MKQHYVMPVGVDDFRQVREEYYYVDKTDFIKSLIDGHSKVTLFTRPRRFVWQIILPQVNMTPFAPCASPTKKYALFSREKS